MSGFVCLFDARTGEFRGRPRWPGSTSEVHAVAMGVVGWQSIIVAGGNIWRGKGFLGLRSAGQFGVWLWDARADPGGRYGVGVTPRGEPLGPGVSATSLTIGVIDDHPVIVSGGTEVCEEAGGFFSRGRDTRFGTVHLWHGRTGEPWGDPLIHEGSVRSVAIGVVDDQPVIISSGWDRSGGTVRLWDARTGAPWGDPLVLDDSVTSVAMGVVDAGPIIVSGASDVRMWDARTGAPRGEPLRHGGSVASVAMGVIDDHPVIVSGGSDGTLCLWDARTGTPRGEPLDHEQSVTSVAIGAVDDRPVVVSGGGRTVRLWDPRTGQLRGEPLRHRGSSWMSSEPSVRSVAIGVIGDAPIIVSGGTEDFPAGNGGD